MASARLRWKLLRDMEGWLDLPMVVLSLVWLAIVVVELVSGTSALLETVGTVIWIIFILEFALRLWLAPDKSAYLKSSWLTVIALLVPALRIFRALRVVRAVRALRGLRLVRIVGTANRSMNALRSSLERRGFGYVVGLTLLVVGLGAAGMLNLEGARETGGGFTSYWDALWWTGMMVTTMSNEYWPQTSEGRVLTFLLSLYSLGVLGYVTATLASFFVGRDAEEKNGPIAGNAEMKALLKEVRMLRDEVRASAPPAGPARPVPSAG
ncbi:ion transporter [Sphingomonas sabuli]|uniref:Ion transporter n=1 Tax=Sphingomonas sabuli TaxID=2764186 RepID=A0A7G9KZY5_9SPHN|nr:ion transporter [Sphingomonas sabuli]QNM81934.1 ion transporter [Sphingomonas sabuli]